MRQLNDTNFNIEAASYAEVVKMSLRLNEALIEDIESGMPFFVQDKTDAMASCTSFGHTSR